ncbi:MAG: hypothetical protein HQL08_02355 [Nitrospirae bacterium]|nr:hypothetical protein [Nitrospirota bacterium]
MKKRTSLALFMLIVFYIAGQSFLILNIAHAQGTDSKPDCDINRAACKKISGDTEIMFDVNPKPVKAMRELNFTVVLKGGTSPDQVFVTLVMPGMYMGENQVVLHKASEYAYTGKGIIPKCRSGKRLWRATVETPEGKKVDFLFSITY